MSAERKKIIEMVAEGKITAEDAERLLEKLGSSERRDQQEGKEPGAETPRTGVPKYLRVVVNSSDDDKVNVRVPLALVRTGLKLTTMLPEKASDQLKEQGIDLSQLSELQGDELLEALRELTVDVESSDGDIVKVFCE